MASIEASQLYGPNTGHIFGMGANFEPAITRAAAAGATNEVASKKPAQFWVALVVLLVVARALMDMGAEA